MPNNILSVDISPCGEKNFQLVRKLITEFSLDDNDLKAEQFLIAQVEGKMAGFGRLRQYPGCSELCSLGVLENLRLKGIGSEISLALIKKSSLPLYTVTIIPSFFEKFGFKTVSDFPSEIAVKQSYCISSLAVPETYVVMRFK